MYKYLNILLSTWEPRKSHQDSFPRVTGLWWAGQSLIQWMSFLLRRHWERADTDAILVEKSFQTVEQEWHKHKGSSAAEMRAEDRPEQTRGDGLCLI